MSDQLKIHVIDGFAHRRVSGYGITARFIILGLVDLGHDV